MMENIEIIQSNNNNDFIFSYRFINYEFMSECREKLYAPKYKYLLRCECGRELDLGYVYFIYNLSEADLLPKDYKPMCCYCNLLACIGFYVPDEWKAIVMYSKYDGLDILVIFSGSTEYEGHFEYEIIIRDIEKVLKTGRVFDEVNLY